MKRHRLLLDRKSISVMSGQSYQRPCSKHLTRDMFVSRRLNYIMIFLLVAGAYHKYEVHSEQCLHSVGRKQCAELICKQGKNLERGGQREEGESYVTLCFTLYHMFSLHGFLLFELWE